LRLAQQLQEGFIGPVLQLLKQWLDRQTAEKREQRAEKLETKRQRRAAKQRRRTIDHILQTVVSIAVLGFVLVIVRTAVELIENDHTSEGLWILNACVLVVTGSGLALRFMGRR
jgi:hypothetical protein